MTRATTCAKIYSKVFTYTKDASGFGGVFTIERSTLDHLGGLSRLYEGGLAIGLVMVSSKTGKEATFSLTSVETNREGEVTCWILSPVFSSYNQPGCHALQHVTVRVYNT